MEIGVPAGIACEKNPSGAGAARAGGTAEGTGKAAPARGFGSGGAAGGNGVAE